MAGVIVTVEDLRGLRDLRGKGYCIRGAKEWCLRHNIDFGQFIREGIESDTLLATGDQLAEDLVRFAEQERSNGKK